MLMQHSSSSIKNKAMFPLLIFVFPLLIIYLFIFKKTPSNLPPGPYQWPIVGNIPNLLGNNPHIVVTNLAQTYGPLISLKLGTQLLIMGSTKQAAAQILKANDRHLSARYTAKATPIKEADLRRYSMLWAPECTQEWKDLRAVWRAELFGDQALDSQLGSREKKANELVDFLAGNEGRPVNIGDVVFGTIFNTLWKHCFSTDGIDLRDEGLLRDWKDTIWKFMEAGTTPTVADFYPVFGTFDPTGQRGRTLGYLKKLFGKWEKTIGERKDGTSCSDVRRGDFLEFMLKHGFLGDKMLHMFLEIFPPACGNLTIVIEWAMAELIKNKDVMNKLLEELKSEIGDSNSIKESQISKLPYLNACVKETMRLHPTIVFIPRRASSACEVMNYTIPKGSLVMINLWALGHDPDTWKDPFLFRPERFLDSDLDYNGLDFEYLPFGAGRRMCPGIQYATKQLHHVLASLVHCFDWSLPDNGVSSELDMKEKYGVPAQKEKPLILIPHKKY